MRAATKAIDPAVRTQAGIPAMLHAAAALAIKFARIWRNRRDVAALGELDERMLADVGITRNDLSDALCEPLWHDPTILLRSRALERRLNRHGVALGLSKPRGLATSLVPEDEFARPRTDRPARFTV